MDQGQQRYANVAVALHWLVAVLILWNVATMLLVPESVSRRLIGTHMAVGLAVLFLSVLRIGWRLTHRWPALPDELAPWEKALARTTHVLFYVLIIVVPLAGWLMVSASRREPVSWFGLFDVPALPVPRGGVVVGYYHDLHEYAAFLTIGLLVLHVGGALKHSVTGRAPGLSRMWFNRRPVGEGNAPADR